MVQSALGRSVWKYVSNYFSSSHKIRYRTPFNYHAYCIRILIESNAARLRYRTRPPHGSTESYEIPNTPHSLITSIQNIGIWNPPPPPKFKIPGYAAVYQCDIDTRARRRRRRYWSFCPFRVIRKYDSVGLVRYGEKTRFGYRCTRRMRLKIERHVFARTPRVSFAIGR